MRWLIAFSILVVSVVLYGAVCFLVEHKTPPRQVDLNHVEQLRPYAVGAAVVTLFAAVGWLRFRVDGKIGGESSDATLTTSQFLTDSIIALSLSNTCAIFGLEFFFLGAPLKEFALFAAGTLFVDFAFILPRGLQFWAAHDRRGDTEERGRRGTR